MTEKEYQKAEAAYDAMAASEKALAELETKLLNSDETNSVVVIQDIATGDAEFKFTAPETKEILDFMLELRQTTAADTAQAFKDL